jgi:hypothetical protein
VVVARCDQIDWIVDLHHNGSALRSLPTQRSLIVAAESKDAPISGQHNGMKASARDPVNCLVEQWIWNAQLFLIVSALLIVFIFVECELLHICQTKGFP